MNGGVCTSGCDLTSRNGIHWDMNQQIFKKKVIVEIISNLELLRFFFGTVYYNQDSSLNTTLTLEISQS